MLHANQFMPQELPEAGDLFHGDTCVRGGMAGVVCNFALAASVLLHTAPKANIRREEGGGVWDPKVSVPKMARSDFPHL